MDSNIFEKANIIANNAEDATIGVIDENGYPSVSTVSSIKTDGITKAFFATAMNANKTKRILNCDKVSVCFREDNDNVTLVGTAKILTGKETKNNLWQDWFINHFPEGPDDPGYCVIEFKAQRASLWINHQSAEFYMSDVMTIQSRCGLLCHFCDYKEPCNCGGCIETNGHPFHGECPVAVCCQNRGYIHCGECSDMPCEQLYAYSCLDKEHGDKPAGARLSVLKYWAKNK